MTNPGKTILIVDDDLNIRQVVRFALEKAGFQTVEAENGLDALARFRSTSPQLVILDILMPEMEGTEVCRQIRKGSRVPIIFLSSCDEEIDRILGLELGGDDYVSKPFSPKELVARVKAVLRRLDPDVPANASRSELVPTLTHGPLSLDPNTFKTLWAGTEVPLTATEFHLLRALLGHPGKVYSRDELMQKVLGDDIVVTERTIDSHVRRIRRKFEANGADPVETVHGVGYRIAPSKASR